MNLIAKNILAIYQRELQNYFTSPLTYIIAAVFWFWVDFSWSPFCLAPRV